MKRSTVFFILLISTLPISKLYSQLSYLDYHNQIIECEGLLIEGKNKEAISQLDALFNQYDFIFLRDIKLATQISAHVGDTQLGFRFLSLGIIHGWPLKDIEKNKSLASLLKEPGWNELSNHYDSLHSIYLSRLNPALKDQLRTMFKQDQKKAFGALFRFSEKSKTKYNESKFAPHSEAQMSQLEKILNQYGYPGEKLIGNNLWGSVILSHHNSISVNYNQADTLFSSIQPQLLNALGKGEISPLEYAIVVDWRTAALSSHGKTSFGFLGQINNANELRDVNTKRALIGLRSTELRNSLIDLEEEKGLELYLPKGWQSGKIEANKSDH